MALLAAMLSIAVRGTQSDFILGDTKVMWTKGEGECNDNYRRTFASIHNDQENTQATNVCKNGMTSSASDHPICWIGAVGSGNGDWTWTDGSDWDYDAWSSPTRSQGHCGTLWWEWAEWESYTSSGCSNDDTEFYPICGEVCTVMMTGTESQMNYWGGYLGAWEPMDVSVGGEPVYTRKYYGSGTTYYLWHETDYSWGGYDTAWVIGTNYKNNRYSGWKWGSDLFNYVKGGYDEWQYWYSAGNRWYYMGWNANLQVACSGSSTDASITISGDDLSAPALNETGFGTNTVPNIVESSSSHFLSMTLGAVIGAAILVVAVVVVLVKRSSRKNTEPAASNHGVVHHVADLTSTDIVGAVPTAKPAETQCTDTVPEDGTDAMEVVVEEAAPKKQ